MVADLYLFVFDETLVQFSPPPLSAVTRARAMYRTRFETAGQKTLSKTQTFDARDTRSSDLTVY